jgi:hypothetical protein
MLRASSTVCTCEVCNETFNSQQEIQQHNKDMHVQTPGRKEWQNILYMLLRDRKHVFSTPSDYSFVISYGGFNVRGSAT